MTCLLWVTALSHDDIEYHHQDEANGETDGTEVGVLAGGCFRNQFLDNHIEHRLLPLAWSACEVHQIPKSGGI